METETSERSCDQPRDVTVSLSFNFVGEDKIVDIEY